MISLREFARKEKVTTRTVGNWMRIVEFRDADFVAKNKFYGGYHNTELFLSDALCEKLREEREPSGITRAVAVNDAGQYTIEDVCMICGCSRRSVERYATTMAVSISEVTTDVGLKKFQLWLKGNRANQGRGSQIVKTEVKKDIVISSAVQEAKKGDAAIAELILSGNVKAMECLMAHYVNETKAVEDRRRLQEENALLKIDNRCLTLENEELRHQMEYDRIKHFKPWNIVKKNNAIKDNFMQVCRKLNLRDGVDYVEKCMGHDSYPTKMLSEEAAERVGEYYGNM